MRIIESRVGFIVFEATNNISLSSFIKICSNEKNYIAQVTQLKNFGDIAVANAKILFLYDDNSLNNYDGTIPSKDSQIELFTEEILNNSIKYDKPIIVAKTADSGCNIVIDSSAFDKKMLISIDSPDKNNLLIKNLYKQFANIGMNTIVIDTLGVIKAKKYVAGLDFKLPLDTNSMQFMYESCLSDATSDSKSTIVEIFNELSEYSKTVPFVPFDTLKSIVDNMVDQQHIFKLLVFKNKLTKYKNLGYFASNINEVNSLDKILDSECAVIDLSKLDSIFLNKYLTFIYEKLQNNNKIQILLEASNTISKKSLKYITKESSLPTTFITHSKFQYLNDMKNMFDNFIIESTLSNKNIFNVYSAFLNPLSKNSFLVTGEALNYIPLVYYAAPVNEFINYTVAENINVQNNIAINEESAENNNIAEELQENCNEEDELNSSTEGFEDNTDSEISKNNTNETSDTERESVNAENESKDTIDESDDMTDEPVITEEESIISEEDIEDSEENNELTDTDNSDEIIKIDLDENEESADYIEDEENTMSEEEIYAAIEEKSNDIIDSVSNDYEENKDVNLFGEDDSDDDSKATDNEHVDRSELLQKIIDSTDYDIEDNADKVEFNQTNDMPILKSEDNLLISQEEFDAEYEALRELEAQYKEEDKQESDNSNSENEEVVEVEEDVDSMLDNDDEEEYEEKDYEALSKDLDIDLTSEPKLMPLNGDVLNDNFEEITELDSSELPEEDDIIVNMDNEDDSLLVDEDTEQQIIEDVDKVYTTQRSEDEAEEFSESDLDLIDELNNDDEDDNSEITEYASDELKEFANNDENDSLLEELSNEEQSDAGEILEKRSSNTPIVPVYDADIPQEDLVMSDPIQQGDAVVHAKYGNGVVEKMIKYGSKTLFAINFENIGRRLLDPTLTEIKRI